MAGHAFAYGADTVQRPTDPAAMCGRCFAIIAWWQLAEGFAPRCTGTLAALPPAPPPVGQLELELGLEPS